MEFTISNDSSIANGTTARGFLKTTYDELVAKLGEPRDVNSLDGKVKCEWILLFSDGSVGTIYNWKTEIIPKDMYYWRVGGKGIDITRKVEKALNTK